jgi:hypothetical protein
MSGGFMVSVGGATQRMKGILRCAILFIAATVYSMAWSDKLANIFKWDDTWIAVSALAGIGSVLMGRRWLVKGPPNLMQRLSRLPSGPDVLLLQRRKSKPFPWLHTTPPFESRLISDGVASTG